jgi:hypothetical protein
MTKPITGMAAMMLIDEASSGSTSRSHEILPKFAQMQVQKVYDGRSRRQSRAGDPPDHHPPDASRTPRASATASSSRARSPQASVSAAWSRAWSPGCRRCRCSAASRSTASTSFADRLAEFPLVYQPGTRWSYSMGLDLMGRVIEVVSASRSTASCRSGCSIRSGWATRISRSRAPKRSA